MCTLYRGGARCGPSSLQRAARPYPPDDLPVFREALLGDLRRRAAEAEGEIVARALASYRRDAGSGSRQRAVERVREALHLFLDHPLVRRHLDLDESGVVEAGSPLEGEAVALERLVAAVEGRRGVAALRHWQTRQPEGLHVLRDAGRRPIAFSLVLDVTETHEADRVADPVVDRAWRHLSRFAPLRAGERASLLRVLAAREDGISPAALRTDLLIDTVLRWHATPQLAYSFALLDRKVGGALAEGARFPRLLDLPRAGRVLALHGRDWRRLPRAAWTEGLIRTGHGHAPLDGPAEEAARVLDRERFAEAVREALKAFARPDALRASPLLGARLVLDQVGPDADPARRAAALRALLEAACDTLREHPRDRKFHDALSATYLRPAPTQDAAAERLGLPFGTYRYRLAQGTSRVVEYLWRLELGSEGEQPQEPDGGRPGGRAAGASG